MKKILKLSAFVLLSVFAFACNDVDTNSEDGRFFDDPTKDHEAKIQEGVVKLDNPYLDWARAYPGLVPDSVYRYIDGIDVTVNMNFSPTSNTIRLGNYGSTRIPLYSTALYAPPAEEITITRPAGSPDITVWIGYSPDVTTTIKDKPANLRRYPKIRKSFSFPSGATTMTIMNYFGGTIFIQPRTAGSGGNPPLGQTGEHTYTFSGVVKPATFIKGKTNIGDWFAQLDTVEVPLIEVIMDNVIWHMPLKDARNAKKNGYNGSKPMTREDFAQLVEFYDDVIEHDYFEYMGMNRTPGDIHQAPDFPLRAQADIQIHSNGGIAAYAGYPSMFNGSSYSTRGLLYELMQSGNAWGFFHEIGHTFQMGSWTWGTGGAHGDELEGNLGINEVSCNFNIFHSATRLRNNWMDESGSLRAAAEDFAAQPDDGKKNFGLSKADITYTPLAEPINANNARISPFMQLGQKYGWKLFAYLAKTSRELTASEWTLIANTGTVENERAGRRRAYFILRACEWAQTDLRPFFDDWGMKYSRGVRNAIAAANFPNVLDKTNDAWWHTFNYTIMPSFDDKDMSGAIKIENSVIWTSVNGDLPRENWVVTTSPLLNDTNVGVPTGNIAEHLIDSKANTYLALYKDGRPMASPVVPLNSKPYFILDTGDTAKTYNYCTYQHRNPGGSENLRGWEFSVYGSSDGASFTLLKSGIQPNRTNIVDLQTFQLDDDFTYRYVKVEFDNYQGRGVPATGNNTIQVSEFGLGLED